MFYVPIAITLAVAALQSKLCKDGNVFGTFLVASIFFVIIIKFFQDYSLVVIMFLGDVFFWIMFFVAIAIRGSLRLYKH